MPKTLLITGATDGIGLETAKLLAADGHTLLLHGRSSDKLAAAEKTLREIPSVGHLESYRADLSKLQEVRALAKTVRAGHEHLDVVINNAGVFKVPGSALVNGLDLRFVVNTIAPYLLTRLLLGAMDSDGRVVNLSSAAQASVDLEALRGRRSLGDSEAYAQSKLALTMWSFHMAQEVAGKGPALIAVNPASLLASKMVKDAYGVAGNDLSVGAEVLVRAALGAEFASANGRYYDNDLQRFADPHGDALNSEKNADLVHAIETLIEIHS